jgi:hypothetical protein
MGSAESNDFFMVFMQLHFAFSSQFNVSYGHCHTHLQLFFRQCDSTWRMKLKQSIVVQWGTRKRHGALLKWSVHSKQMAVTVVLHNKPCVSCVLDYRKWWHLLYCTDLIYYLINIFVVCLTANAGLFMLGFAQCRAEGKKINFEKATWIDHVSL